MINVKDKICTHGLCTIVANYNYSNELRPLYCNTHKLDGMINVRGKKCMIETCNTAPIYNIKGSKSGLYCSIHKLDGMINVLDKVCIHDTCTTLANYNYSNTPCVLYCSKHKLKDMINIKKKPCIEENCTIEPIYNYESLKTPLYCFAHKKENMINIKDRKKWCIEENCKIIAVYNYENEIRPFYCATHKKDTMVDIISKKCIENGCNKLSTFNYTHLNCPVYCSKHKKDEMINIKDKNDKCISPFCNTHASNKKYEGYCRHCYIHLFPDKPLIRNHKTKEKHVSSFIAESFKDITIVCDKPIANGCSNRRPDLFIDLGYQAIMIEIDEDCHYSYDTSCENKRLMILSQDINHRPLIIIRFNPDRYKDSNGKYHKSCWSRKKNGLYSVTNQEEWAKRLNSLKQTLQYWLDNTTTKTIEIISLFYN